MRKRLRKKNRVGEYRELEFPVAFRLNSKLSEEEVDAFLQEAVAAMEARGLAFVATGDVEWHGAVARLGRGSPDETDQDFVREWLEADERVESVVIGVLQDAWHRPMVA